MIRRAARASQPRRAGRGASGCDFTACRPRRRDAPTSRGATPPRRGRRPGGCSQVHPGMFVETIVLPRREWERWNERLRLAADPPEALIASIAWDSGDGEVTGVNVWETPGPLPTSSWSELGRSWRPRASPPTSPSDAASRSRSTCAPSLLGERDRSSPRGWVAYENRKDFSVTWPRRRRRRTPAACSVTSRQRGQMTAACWQLGAHARDHIIVVDLSLLDVEGDAVPCI